MEVASYDAFRLELFESCLTSNDVLCSNKEFTVTLGGSDVFFISFESRLL